MNYDMVRVEQDRGVESGDFAASYTFGVLRATASS